LAAPKIPHIPDGTMTQDKKGEAYMGSTT
jgi:hypothetical protein